MEKQCIPITEEEAREITEKHAQNIRDAGLSSFPAGIERLEVNLKSFIETNKELAKNGRCLMWQDPISLAEEFLTIIKHDRTK